MLLKEDMEKVDQQKTHYLEKSSQADALTQKIQQLITRSAK